MSASSLHSLLIESARSEGFSLAGALDILPLLTDPESAFNEHVRYYDEWLQAGYAGAMSYLVRGRDRRADPRIVLPDAKSMLCVAVPYRRIAAGAPEASRGARYARYIQGRDYHDEIAEGLERAMKSASARWEAQGHPALKWKVCVDTSAVLERTWAALAGLGWIGKNTLLIHPQHGSYLFLAEVLIDQETGHGPAPLKDYCGNCQRCMQACPTKAFTRPHQLDSNRCISYNTLERRGPLTELDPSVRDRMGPWIAGCDICQEVCPFNTKAVKRELESLLSGDARAIANDASALHDWASLLKESPEEYRARIKDSALSRVKPAQFSRNLAMALGRCWSDIAAGERETLKPLIASRLEREPDADALQEWQRLWAGINRVNG